MVDNVTGTGVIFLKSLSETESFGEKLGELALPGDVICLEGDLGAGKTTLTQAIAKGLDVPDSCYVTSPSFAILHEYPGRIPLYHMDFYRLHDVSEIEDLGFEEYFYLLGLTVIEWPERAGDLLPANRLRLRIENSGECGRSVHYACASSWEERLIGLVREYPEFLSKR
jgi:tRNA threonylcarbamoyladenosine biosynthesis protein TsaE